MLSLTGGASSRRLTRQCTCAAETESDSDDESDAGRESLSLADAGRTASAPPSFRGATNEEDDQVASGDDENGNGSPGSSNGASLDPFFPQTTWAKSLSLLELTKAVHDPLKASQALHNAEALRQAPALDNVFCSCYDVDTVLTTVQRRERGHFSPVQKLLLEPESIKQVFAYATSFSDEHHDLSENGVDEEATGPNSRNHHPDKYRQCYVATEIILRFYIKAMAWYGEPKQDPVEENADKPENGENPTENGQPDEIQDRKSASAPGVSLEGLAVSSSTAPTNMLTMMDFRSNASTRKMARIQRLRASMRFESSGSSISEFSVNGDEDEELLEDPVTRGYLLRLEDLTANEWKRIFGGLFRFLWPKVKHGENNVQDDEVEVDSVLVANMCRITKNFVTFPAVHRLICDENEDSEGEWLLSRLAAHAYNPDIASLLHGLIHLSIRRGFEYFPIVRCLVERIVEQVPTRLARSMSAVSSTSTVSSTSSASPRSSLGGSPPSVSPSSFFSSKTAPLSPSLFTTNTTSTVHARISGCAEILTKILKDEFPNTFRYYIQTKIQLASFESVETFERELFPPRMAPSDPAMHYKLKCAVLAALVENSTILARLAELGMAELRFLDAHYVNDVCIPRVLVIDTLRHAIEFCLHDSEQLEVFVAPIHLVLDTICASINYHQHLSTISEFAARDCFSDSDSDDDDTEDGEDLDSVAGKDSPSKPVKRPAAVPGRTALYMGITPPALSYSPRSGKAVVNHRPLASTLLVMHVVELLDAVIRMSNDRIDSRLSRLDLATSLMDIFEKFPKASILHCRLVKLYLNLLNRPTTNGRVNNPLLRSVFRSPDSILEFILQKLHANSLGHIYDAHLAIIGVKIAKICSSPTLQQELIRQFCNNVKGWNDFASSLVATHYQQMDALDDSLLGLQVVTGGGRNGTPRKRNTSEDEVDADFPLARPSSSASEYLSRELEPFRRLPMEKEGFGSSHNLARGNEAVHPSDMFQSRSQSKFPESIIDILQSDESTPFDVEEDEFFVSGCAYQKRSKWAKVHLKFEKATCQLTLQDATAALCESPSNGAAKATSPSKASMLKQFLLAQTQTWTSRPKKLVVCNARKWIAFGRSLKKPNRGAFGFQVDVFDGHREEDETLTFVTRSEAIRMRWFEAMQCAVTRTRTARNSFSDIDEAGNTELVECVAKNRDGVYLVVPDVNLLGPMTSASFFIKSEVPEEMPFWGAYHGDQGIIKYVSLFKQCLDVVSVEEKSIQAIGYSVIVEFDATFHRSPEGDLAMFLCARDASARPQGAPGAAHALAPSSDDAQRPAPRPARALAPHRPPLRPSLAEDAQASAAYLRVLAALTRLVAQLLDVHALSPSLRFVAGEAVAVDAAEWWRELQRRSVARLQRQEAAHERGKPTGGSRLWPLAARGQEQQQDHREDSGVWVSSRTFEDLPEDMWTDRASDLFVQALYLIIQAMDRVSTAQGQEIEQVDAASVVDALASVDAGAAFAAAQLLHMWAPVSQKTLVDSAQKLASLLGVAVVNVLLQPRGVGVKHAFHEHALLPSLPLRAFLGAKQWRCSVCERVTQTSGDSARAGGVYRCAACNFNLCRECFTRIPNVKEAARRSNPLADVTRLTTDRFFELVVPQLKHKTGAVAVRQIAQELRRRVLELYPHNFQAAAEFAQLFHNLLAADKAAALALVMSPPASKPSSSGRPAVAWFPLFMRTWTMSLSTLLGPFLRATSILDDAHEIDAAVRAANHGSAVADCLRAQWMNGYAEFRRTLQTLMKTLLSNDQHPIVVDATLCWLALTLMTADPRRRLNYDAHERLDGFLVNVTTMLLAYTLPLLDKAQHDPSAIDARYHQSVEPARVYASKDFPEVPLHYSRSTQDARASEKVADSEMSEIQSRDEICIATYNARRIQRSQEDHDEEEKEVDSTYYYPRLSCHEGVVCDRCEFANIHHVRYKCAFCGDMDLCSSCFEDFRSHQAATDSSSESESEAMVHYPDHVFLRIESPIPVFALKHFQPLPADLLTTSKQKDDASKAYECVDEVFDASSIHCADCGDTLGATGQPDDVFYKCANCISTRFVCAMCLTREEKLSNGNPNEMHAPGHMYFVVTDPWRRQLQIPWGDVVRKLHFQRLLHPPALIPRVRFPRSTEMFYVTLKYLHFGPLATLSRWLSMLKEVQELQAFCACDEERFEVEKQRRERRRRQNRSLNPSVHYKASKARLEDIRVKCVKMELHLLESANIAEWLVFYARTCRWLLHTASTTPADSLPGTVPQDPFAEPLSYFSPMFSGFPEHFFFDLCDVVYLLGLEKLEYRELVSELKGMKQNDADSDAVDEVREIVEPLLIMLTQIVVAPKFTKNPHLRVEALRSLTTLLTFVSKGQQVQHRPGHRRMEALFKRHPLLSRYLIPGLLQFHSDMDRYNASNNGLAFTSAVTSGDHMLWGFLPTRVSVTMLLRYLWQLPSQRQSLLQMLSAPDAVETSQSSLSAEPDNCSTQQLTGLVSGLWSDIAKLFDEAHNKITTLRQIHDLIEDSLDGSVVVLPFRRDMLDGYVAINAKQLRLTMRLLLEALELTSWFAAIISGEGSFRSRSVSAPATALRHVLLQPLVVEQAARTLSFLVASLANAHEEKEWVFSLPLVEDGKLLLAHLIVLVVRYSGHSALKSSGSSTSSSFCSPSSFWKIVQSSGDIMERRVGDLDTHVRWGLNALCTRIESESYLGSSLDDDDDDVEEARMVVEEAGHELDEDEALALLEKQSESIGSSVGDAATTKKRLGKRFIATLAKDGRFDFRLFVGGCRFLRPHRKQDLGSSSDEEEETEDVGGGYLYLDDSWVQQFVRAMHEADEMIHVQEAMEACLGDIPDQYLDPLLSTLMTDPVRLPSGNIVDRAVIARHLLASAQQGGSTGRDPFTREPLTMAMVEPCDALRLEIQLYLRTKMRHFRKTAREDVLATWGLGWDVLFDSSSETEADSEDGAEGGTNATMSSTSS